MYNNSMARPDRTPTAPCALYDPRPECQQAAALPDSAGAPSGSPLPGSSQKKAPNAAQSGTGPGSQTGDTVSRLR